MFNMNCEMEIATVNVDGRTITISRPRRPGFELMINPETMRPYYRSTSTAAIQKRRERYNLLRKRRHSPSTPRPPPPPPRPSSPPPPRKSPPPPAPAPAPAPAPRLAPAPAPAPEPAMTLNAEKIDEMNKKME
ncbi:hypothetical protein SNEBB_001805, partial [Seison nebaliae]